jgi:cation diffusion facilitator CzcD-associated flavoprotein CzcO
MIDALIIGAGFSGICAAIKLKQAGFEFLLLERAMTVGGTWRDNTYPGCACDIPSVLYSFSFAPSRNWTRTYPQQPEIQAYLERVFRDYELGPHTRFNIDVLECRFDETRSVWSVIARTTHGVHQFEARHVVMATGPLNKPALPDIPGRDFFHGVQFHSMNWRHDVDLTNRHITVIGTGASAIQFVPEIAKVAASVTVFQRTPPWVVPRMDRPVGAIRSVLRAIPGLQRLERSLVYWRNETVATAFLGGKRALSWIKSAAKWHMRRALTNKALQHSLTPNYEPGCKRILVSDDWYPALNRGNVRLICGSPKMIERAAVVTQNDETIKADMIVYGTGFKVQEFVRPMKVFGRGGVDLGEIWRDAPAKSYYGICVNRFPNMFALVGPNTGLGHNSIVFMIEAQMRWIIKALSRARDESKQIIEVTPEAEARVYGETQDKMSRSVWATGGCKSYYKAENGRIDTIWPDYTWKYWLKTRRFEARDFTLT